LKIVHIITRLVLGGAQENTLITCAELTRRGYDVTLITGPALGPEGGLFEQTKGQGYNVIVLDKLRRPINPFYDAVSYRQIKKLLWRIAPDVVHTHSAKAGILGRFAAYAMKGKSAAPSAPVVVHTIHGLAFGSFQNELLNRFYIAIEKSAAKRTDFFISVADAMTTQALTAGVGKPGQFVTAYSAIDEEDFLKPANAEVIKDFRSKYGIAEDATVLVTIARLTHLKGHEYIIESAKQLSRQFDNCVWLFVGDGNLAGRIKKQVSDLGLSQRIKFTGLLPPKQIPLAIQSSDILVHCSLREGLAKAIPQAMLCARPVVSFDLDGAAEVVSEKTGRLIDAGNVEQLIKACAELIADKQLRQRLGDASRQFAKDRFAPVTMVDKIEEIYKKPIGNYVRVR